MFQQLQPVGLTGMPGGYFADVGQIPQFPIATERYNTFPH
ncbi:MAG: hypothetical protein OJF51_002448 [Nitrospira sp.]|nr:MAG: hypothetical protein OJF51_002448 [Nitrospira sp.]